MNRFFCTLFLVFGAFTASFSEDDISATEIFSKAVRFYKTGEYDSTITAIRVFLKNHGKDPEAEYLVPLVMEAFLRKGEYAPVRRLFDLY
jgi:hypothetical protein